MNASTQNLILKEYIQNAVNIKFSMKIFEQKYIPKGCLGNCIPGMGGPGLIPGRGGGGTPWAKGAIPGGKPTK